jgi:hypothetical protein
MPRDVQRPLVQPRDAEHSRVALAPGAPQSEEQHLGTANQPLRRRVNQRLALPQRQALQKIVRRGLSAPVFNCHTARAAIRRESAQCREHHVGGGRKLHREYLEKNTNITCQKRQWVNDFILARKGNITVEKSIFIATLFSAFLQQRSTSVARAQLMVESAPTISSAQHQSSFSCARAASGKQGNLC